VRVEQRHQRCGAGSSEHKHFLFVQLRMMPSEKAGDIGVVHQYQFHVL